MAVKTNSPQGTSASAPFDRWFRYPAGFSESTADACIKAVQPEVDDVICDPFAGSGVVAVRLRKQNCRFEGIEAHELIAELANLKIAKAPSDPTELGTRARELAGDLPSPKIDAEHELVRRCFDKDTLRSLVAIRLSLESIGSDDWTPYMTWALLATLRDTANVRVGWPYQRPGKSRRPISKDPVKRFIARCEAMASDLKSNPPNGKGKVICGDSRLAETWKGVGVRRKLDGCITSPPYLNNFDYADATRLELFFLQRAASWAEMCRLVRDPMLIATTQQSSRGRSEDDGEWLSEHSPVSAKSIHALTLKLELERQKKPRGKEYDRVVPSYFRGMAEILANLQANLKVGASAALVVGDSAPYGVFVDTPKLLASIATESGFSLCSNRKIRDRGLRWRTNGTRHQVGLSERLVHLRRD